jgi:hypothetical protein
MNVWFHLYYENYDVHPREDPYHENRSLLPVDKDLSPMETDDMHPKEFRFMDVHPKKYGSS